MWEKTPENGDIIFAISMYNENVSEHLIHTHTQAAEANLWVHGFERMKYDYSFIFKECCNARWTYTKGQKLLHFKNNIEHFINLVLFKKGH